MSELELTVNRRIAAPREKVFNAWLSPATLAKFMRASSDSTGPSDVSTDAVKGGRFSILMHRSGLYTLQPSILRVLALRLSNGRSHALSGDERGRHSHA